MGNLKYISLAVCLYLIALSTTEAAAATYFNGAAELSYAQYDAKADGKKIYDGDSFAQKYSVAWGATNLVRLSQPQYYKVLLGYDWATFDTNIETGENSRKISEAYGKFRYNGLIGYQPEHLPIRFKAYAFDDAQPQFRRDLYRDILADGLTVEIYNKYKGRASGFTFVFEPERAYAPGVRGLPRLHIDYRESISKSDYGLNQVDSKTRELAVAGLNKENNWLHYRTIKFENHLNPNDNYEQQQIQIGLIDYVGSRKWSALTNWITVSADGQLTARENGDNHYFDYEEYDLNFQAIASRKLWEAKTFMNYNRELRDSSITEYAKIPLYVRGIWGRETNWNFSLNESRGRQHVGGGTVATSYLNSVSLGLTTFTRSSFTLSPSLSLKTYKSFASDDSYLFNAGVTTASTKLFSKDYSLFAGYNFTAQGDGSDSASNSNWNQKLNVKARYGARYDLSVEVAEEIQSGTGASHLESSRLNSGSGSVEDLNDYVRSITTFSGSWVKSASLRNTASASYDILKIQGAPVNTEFNATHSIEYQVADAILRMYTRYSRRDTGTNIFNDSFANSGSVEYRPNRYNDASLHYDYFDQSNDLGKNTSLELTQKYNHYFYTRTGVLRNIATISEEYTYRYSSQSGSVVTPGRASSIDSQSLLLSGRYSPTSRLSLYGSARYQKDFSAVTMVYTAGLSADFKLLTTNLDYSMGTRDSDKRVEKKFAANVKRSF